MLDKLAESKEFSADIMNAAQASNTEEVKRLIYSLGVTSDLDVHYTPESLRVEFKSKVENVDCCRLVLGLRLVKEKANPVVNNGYEDIKIRLDI